MKGGVRSRNTGSKGGVKGGGRSEVWEWGSG